MRRILKIAGGLAIAAGVMIVLGTIGADDRMIINQGAGMPWPELLIRIAGGFGLCGLGGLAILAGSVIR